MNPLRIAIIGAGMGRYGLLPAFLQNSRVQIAAVCAGSKERAMQFANQYQIANAYDSWQTLLEKEVDLVAIATPPAVQAEITHAFLQKKTPLFLEKQIALNLWESQELLDLSIRNQVPTCVNFIFPYLHTWRLMHRYLQEKRLGQLRHAFLNWRMESYDQARHTPNIWKTDDQLGGGVMQHFLSHSFHYLEHLFGKIDELRCLLSPAPDLCARGSVVASLDLIFDQQFLVHVAASNGSYAGIGHVLEIYGSEGSLILKNETSDPVLGFNLYFSSRGEKTKLVDSESDHYSSKQADSRIWPTSHLVDAFLHSIDGGKIAHPTIMDGYRVQEILHHARNSHKNRCFVKITKGNADATKMENSFTSS